ncbi:VOC family protein [Aeromicrobium choanae]|uniref:Glyoxalase-like domain-containing protein n=1 Tax=Aeromicrobium choanae TaxID=1736691 RepID=A0A1T4YUJ0_9ACTN|nr:hypothetical protein [Aeromicrobium choanae]SKB05258.1 hypothetical protein SAMN06295964_0879 [Aeromicrobium choanae]
MTSPFPILRQVVIGARDLEATSRELRETFHLEPGFADPLLEEMHLADETIPVGPEAHLELVGPLSDRASINAWLDRVGGTSGYCISVQVPDLDPHLAAIEAAGVRLAIQAEAYGRRIVQLHPGDMGLLVELDEIPDADEWFWDHLEHPPSPDPWIDDVVGIDLATPDPQGRAERWAAVFRVPVLEKDGHPVIELGTRTVRFVQDEAPRMSAIDVRATPAGAGLPEAIELGRVTLRVLRD